MAAITTAVTTIVLGVTAIVLGAYSAAAQAKAQSDMADYNSDVANAQAEQERLNAEAAQHQAEMEAIAVEQNAAQQEKLEREHNRKLKALNRARSGASGLANEGTPLLWEIEQAQNMEVNALEIRRQGQTDAQNVRYQGYLNSLAGQQSANSYLAQSQSYKQMASNSRSIGAINATSSAVSGAASMSSSLIPKN